MKTYGNILVLIVLISACYAMPSNSNWLKNSLKGIGKIPVPKIPVKPATLPPAIRPSILQQIGQETHMYSFPQAGESLAPNAAFRESLKNALEGKKIEQVKDQIKSMKEFRKELDTEIADAKMDLQILVEKMQKPVKKQMEVPHSSQVAQEAHMYSFPQPGEKRTPTAVFEESLVKSLEGNKITQPTHKSVPAEKSANVLETKTAAQIAEEYLKTTDKRN